MTRNEIAEISPEAIVYDDLDEAIIGFAERINLGPVVAYDREKVIEILKERMVVDLTPVEIDSGLTVENLKYEMAVEYFEFNIYGAWVGNFTPVFITTNLL